MQESIYFPTEGFLGWKNSIRCEMLSLQPWHESKETHLCARFGESGRYKGEPHVFFPDDLLCVFPLGFLSVISVIPKGRKSWHAQKSCQMFLWKWIWNAFFYCVLCEHCVCKRAWERLLALEMVFFCTGKCQKRMHLFSKNKS